MTLVLAFSWSRDLRVVLMIFCRSIRDLEFFVVCTLSDKAEIALSSQMRASSLVFPIFCVSKILSPSGWPIASLIRVRVVESIEYFGSLVLLILIRIHLDCMVSRSVL